jgi:hypothetical protein
MPIAVPFAAAATAVAAVLCAGTAEAALTGLPSLAGVQPLGIHDGVNAVPAFTSDGAAATIVLVHRENGNAHSSDWLLVAVDGKPEAPGMPGVPGVLQLVERDEPAAQASALFGILPFDGENEIRALRLARARIDGRPEMLMLQAERRVSETLTLASPKRVDLQVWRLDGLSDAVGRESYRFVLTGRATTTRLY